MLNLEINPEPEHDDLQLNLVTLTLQNKQRLFQDAIESSEKSMENTRALLANMEQFDPSTAQRFGFKNVAISQAPFRLLRSTPKRTKAITRLERFLKNPEAAKGRSHIMSTSSTSDTTFKSFIALSYS